MFGSKDVCFVDLRASLLGDILDGLAASSPVDRQQSAMRRLNKVALPLAVDRVRPISFSEIPSADSITMLKRMASEKRIAS